MKEPTIGDNIKLNSAAGETGTIIQVMRRGEFLAPLYKIAWDDTELGTGVLFEHEFTVESVAAGEGEE